MRTLRSAEPNLRANLSGGLLVASDAVLYPPCGAASLLDQACRRGAVPRRKTAIAMGDGRVKMSDASQIASERIVNAMGAMAGELTPGLPIRKRKAIQ